MKKLTKLSALILSAALILNFSACQDSGDSGNNAASEPFYNALSTLKTVEGVPNVYTIEFDGEYYLNGAINADLTTANKLLNYLNDTIPFWKTAKVSGAPVTIDVKGAACSSIVAENATYGTSGYIYGRNFDWDEGPALIIHTMPDGGYESVSTCYIPFITNDASWTPSSETVNDSVALAGIYVPMDGMNEKGLYIANLNDDIIGKNTVPSDDLTKKNVQTTVAIRYILDNAASVEDAVKFLNKIDMFPVYEEQNTEDDPVYSYHFAIADNKGKSVVAEWLEGGELKVTETKVVTNFNIYKNNGNTSGKCKRFDSLVNAGNAANWKMTSEQVKNALANVQQSHSEWSAVFEPCEKRVTYYFRGAAPQDEDKPIDYTKPVVVQF